MPLIKVILVDDEPRGLNVLQLMMEGYADRAVVVASCLEPQQAVQKINELNPDLVIMDIQMPRMTAFDVISALHNPQVEVIFATAYNAYALRAFQYSAVDYLLKPIDEDHFRRAIEKAIQRIHQKNATHHFETLLYNIQKVKNSEDMRICIPDAKGFKVIRVSDILYCEADSCYTMIHLHKQHSMLSSRSLAEYDALLDPAHFCRIHRSSIINVHHVKEYRKGEGGSVIMADDKALEVSRRKKEEFLEKMKGLYSI